LREFSYQCEKDEGWWWWMTSERVGRTLRRRDGKSGRGNTTVQRGYMLLEGGSSGGRLPSELW
jgi:hypothetical protein